AGTIVQADGISPDGGWLRIVREDVVGWLERPLMTDHADVSGLPTLTADLLTPMQAFRFRTGIGQPACEQAPDALVVQGPTNMNVNLSANGADITLGSTIVLRTITDEDSAVVLPGHRQTARSVAFMAGGDRSITGDEDGTIRVWNSDTSAILQTFSGHEGPVIGVGVREDEQLLVSAGADGTV